jgi:hypothetical protein
MPHVYADINLLDTGLEDCVPVEILEACVLICTEHSPGILAVVGGVECPPRCSSGGPLDSDGFLTFGVDCAGSELSSIATSPNGVVSSSKRLYVPAV